MLDQLDDLFLADEAREAVAELITRIGWQDYSTSASLAAVLSLWEQICHGSF